ncbi:MAG: enoyl-CoA hydratase/isomerase family protein [Gemmatimonadota bacterium]
MIRECKFLCYIHEAYVATITLDQPPANHLDIRTLQELDDVLSMLRADSELKGLVVTGHGRIFCAGFDVSDHRAECMERMPELFGSVVQRLLDFECPVVAAVNGPALGAGCELALTSDVILASAEAEFGQPEIRLAKKAALAGLDLPFSRSLKVARKHYLDEFFGLDDAREGLSAFLDRRAPV